MSRRALNERTRDDITLAMLDRLGSCTAAQITAEIEGRDSRPSKAYAGGTNYQAVLKSLHRLHAAGIVELDLNSIHGTYAHHWRRAEPSTDMAEFERLLSGGAA